MAYSHPPPYLAVRYIPFIGRGTINHFLRVSTDVVGDGARVRLDDYLAILAYSGGLDFPLDAWIDRILVTADDDDDSGNIPSILESYLLLWIGDILDAVYPIPWNNGAHDSDLK